MKRRLAVSLLLVVFLAGWPRTALAHPAYKDSDPRAGATVSAPPTELWIDFTESIEDGYVHVYDPCGERVDHGEMERNLTNDRITVGTHGDKAGAYRVEWEVLGSDGHVTRGEFSFSSSSGDTCPVDDDDDPEPEPDDPPKDDDDDVDTRTDETTDDARSPQERSDDAGARERTARAEARQRQSTREADRTDDTQALAQETTDTQEAAATGIWDGIPIGDFMIALVVAALIGAAGGRIYAGILGPRR